MSLRQLKLFDALYKSDFFIRSLPYGSQFSPTYNLGLLLDLIQVPVFDEVALLVWWYTSTHPLKYLNFLLLMNPHRSEILPRKHLDYKCKPLHPALSVIKVLVIIMLNLVFLLYYVFIYVLWIIMHYV